MPNTALSDVLRNLCRVWETQAAMERTDGELLERFVTANDEAAFTALVRRHGPLVLAVARRVLGDFHASEDVFQATFLVLVRRAKSIWKHKPLAGWLFAVARRIALRARTQAAARGSLERRLESTSSYEQLDEPTWQEVRAVLDEEIGRLPEKYRVPVVLCHLQGLSFEKAADQLGWPKSSLANRLTKARELLRSRLVRRGIVLSAAAMATALGEKVMGAPVAALLNVKTVKAAMNYAAGKAMIGGSATANSIVLAEQTLKTMLGAGAKLALLFLAFGGIVGSATVAGYGVWLQQASPVKRHVVQSPSAKTYEAASVPQKTSPGLDGFGDPLPAGALARLGTVRFRPGGAIDLAFAPDGKTLASGGALMSGVCLWDVPTGRRLFRVGINPRAISLAFSPDGKTLFNGGDWSFLDAATGKPLRKVEAAVDPHDIRVAFSPDGTMVAGGGSFGSGNAGVRAVIVWNAASGKELRRWPSDPRSAISKLAFSADSKALAVAAWSDTVRLWDLASGKEIRAFEHGKQVRFVAFAPKGKLVATSGDDVGLRLWSADTGELKHWLKDGKESYTAVAFSKDSKMLAGAGRSGMIRIFKPETGQEIRRWQANSGAMYSVAFSPNGELLASVGAMGDMSIRIWKTDTGTQVNPSLIHTNAPNSLTYSVDGKTLFSCSGDQRVLEWDLMTGRQRDRLAAIPLGPPVGGYGSPANAVSPDGTILAQEAPFVDDKGHSAIRLFDTVSGKQLRQFGPVSLLRALKFSPDGKLLASASAGGIQNRDPSTGGIHLWDQVTGKEVGKFEPGNLDVNYVAFSPNGKLLASVDFDIRKIARDNATTIRLWDVATQKELQTWESNHSPGFLVFSPDSKSIAFANGAWVRLLATGTGKEMLRRPQSATDFKTSLAFSPSGRVLAVAESDTTRIAGGADKVGKKRVASCTIRLWDVHSGEEIRHIQVPPQSFVTAMEFTPDGRTLASGGGDSAILFWDVTARPTEGQSKPHPPNDDELNGLWSNLAGDAAKADQAIWDLARAPKQSGKLLQERLRVTPVTAEQMAKLIADLDSSQFAVRQNAGKILQELGGAARLALHKALDTPQLPLEVRRRIELILNQGDKEVIRTLRAVEALEHIGTPEARQVLQKMTDMDPRVSEAAAAALKRLGNR